MYNTDLFQKNSSYIIFIGKYLKFCGDIFKILCAENSIVETSTLGLQDHKFIFDQKNKNVINYK